MNARNSIYDSSHYSGYLHHNSVNRNIASNIFSYLNDGAYHLSENTTRVLEYCFSEDRLELIPLFLWLQHKLDNIRDRICVEFVNTMRIVTNLLDSYESKVLSNAIHPPPTKKFLSTVEAKLEMRVRELDLDIERLIGDSGGSEKLGDSLASSRAGYITYRMWPHCLTAEEIRDVYSNGGERRVIEHFSQRYSMTQIPLHALRQFYSKNI